MDWESDFCCQTREIVGKFDDKYFIEFTCKTIINETEADYNGAFKTPEVQYIIENLKAK